MKTSQNIDKHNLYNDTKNLQKYSSASFETELTISGPGDGGGGGVGGKGEGGGRVPALISTFENFANFTKIYWITQFCKFFFVKGITCCQGNAIFDAMFSQILTFLYFFF